MTRGVKHGDVGWTAARIVKLTELWASGVSTAKIGALMNLGKNAIIGKAHRLDLPGRPSPISPRGSGVGPKKLSPARRIIELPACASLDVAPTTQDARVASTKNVGGIPPSTTPEQRAQMREMWMSGLAASAIDEKMGVTKGVVVGVSHREKWPSRPLNRAGLIDPKSHRKRVIPPVAELVAKVPAIVVPASPRPTVRPLPIATVTAPPVALPAPPPIVETAIGGVKWAPPNCCQWPIGTPRTPSFRFCGNSKVVGGGPYCAQHHARAYQREPARTAA